MCLIGSPFGPITFGKLHAVDDLGAEGNDSLGMERDAGVDRQRSDQGAATGRGHRRRSVSRLAGSTSTSDVSPTTAPACAR